MAPAGCPGDTGLLHQRLAVGRRLSVLEFQKVIAKAEQGIHPAPTPTPLPPNVQPYDADPTRPGFTYDGSPTLGSDKAPVVVFIFSDFNCRTASHSAKTVEAGLREKYVKPGQVRLVYKSVPITAPKTGIAALCAADQGKFWEFYDRLVAEQGKWKDGDNAAMSGYAKALGLDTAKFEKCLTDAPGQAQLDADLELAQQVNVDPDAVLPGVEPGAGDGSAGAESRIAGRVREGDRECSEAAVCGADREQPADACRCGGGQAPCAARGRGRRW